MFISTILTKKATQAPNPFQRLAALTILRVCRAREHLSRFLPAVFAAGACTLAACSTNAGFGTPVSEPNPVAPYPQAAVSAPPGQPQVASNGTAPASPAASPAPTPTPVPNTLSITGTSLRLAYDGAAKGPLTAPRLVEVSFALQNTTSAPATVRLVRVQADTANLPDIPVKVTAAPGQTSAVALLAFATPLDPAKYKAIVLTFLDDRKKVVGTAHLEIPAQEAAFTALDEKHPQGVPSIDSAEVSPISNGPGPRFEVTFALTNPSQTPLSVTELEVKPPQGDVVRVPLSLDLPMRVTSGFLSVVLPYRGKSLPAGTYAITARERDGQSLQASAVLL